MQDRVSGCVPSCTSPFANMSEIPADVISTDNRIGRDQKFGTSDAARDNNQVGHQFVINPGGYMRDVRRNPKQHRKAIAALITLAILIFGTVIAVLVVYCMKAVKDSSSVSPVL